MPPRRNTRRRRIEEVYGDGNPPPNQLNPEISEVVQQALNSMMPGLITQVVEVVRQAGATATPNNAGGTGLTSSGTTTATVGTQLTLHQWLEKFRKQKPQSFSSATNPAIQRKIVDFHLLEIKAGKQLLDKSITLLGNESKLVHDHPYHREQHQIQ
ncbi:hypothetical protein L6452_27190 [Arctium lappa]|uniref:Uncharacterized protein n=1 Tax=Arctium lappa TaxID=4217 RepID=A0ACB8ZVU9_ARCLA|nr:hypothetical protein L6452_27190 [Arctium lappa]